VRRLIYALVLAVSGFMIPQASAQDFGFGCCPPACGSCCESGFDGIYVGGNLGAFHNLVSCNDYDAFFSQAAPAGFSAGRTAFTAGVQLGYDWQCGNKLLGIVGDWNWTHAKRNFPFVSNGLTAPALTDVANNNRNRWFSTIRARVGIVVCGDALVYVTGGAAVIEHRSEWNRTTTALGVDNHRAKDHQWGWTAGVGIEYKVGCNWSLGAEVLSLHFTERQKHIIGRTSPTITLPFRLGFTDSAYVARVLLNYRIGGLLGF